METNSEVGKVRGYRDVELNKFRKVMQLDEAGHYFYTIILNGDGMFDKYSIDVKKDDEVHYEFGRELEKELRNQLHEYRSWIQTPDALIEFLKANNGTEQERIMHQIVTAE